MSGILRTQLLDLAGGLNYADEITDELKNYVNLIEQRVNEIEYLLDIDSLADLDNVQKAYDKAAELSQDLY